MSRRVKVDGLEKAINDILTDYGEHVTEGTKVAVKRIADEAKRETRAGSPVRSGKYRKGWAVKTTTTRLSAESIVHNRTSYQLTHLLEKGHALRIGGRTIGRVKAFPHIGPAEERAVQRFTKAVENVAKG
jgi:hypothetical protein